MLDPEHCVRIKIRIAFDEQVRRHALISGRAGDDMHMSRPIGMTSHAEQHFADRTIGGNRIAHRLHGFEPVAAVHAGGELATRVMFISAWALYVVDTFTVGLPDIEHCASN